MELFELLQLTGFFFVFFGGGAMLHGMWDLTSRTRDQTHAPCCGSAEC